MEQLLPLARFATFSIPFCHRFCRKPSHKQAFMSGDAPQEGPGISRVVGNALIFRRLERAHAVLLTFRSVDH